MFETILGQDLATECLSKFLTTNKLPHALLFSGPGGEVKGRVAQELAAHLLRSDLGRVERETHPDYHPMRPEGKSGLHAIEAVRALIDEVHAAPFEAPAKVFVLYEAERMQPAAANALLKTLEEPSPNTTLMLLASAPSRMLPTVLSRCIRLNFEPPPYVQPPFHELLFSLLAAPLPYHRLAASIEQLEAQLDDEDPVKKGEKIEQLLVAVLMWARDQHVREIAPERLFFRAAPSGQCPSVEVIEQAVDEVRLGLERNMKLSACLDRLLLKIYAARGL